MTTGDDGDGDVSGDGSGEDLLGLLGRWSAGDRQRQAATARVRERRLRQVEAESATLAGLLVNVAERGSVVAMVVGGRRLVGKVVAVGRDFCVVEDGAARSTLARTAAVAALWPAVTESGGDGDGGGGVAGGDRRPVLAMDLAGALAQLAGELMPARLWLAGDEVVEGQLMAAGADLLTVRTASRSYAYVSIPLVTACTPA